MFETILVAKRGELAARVARTCQQRDVKTVALTSSADETGVHVEACDEVTTLKQDDNGGFTPSAIAKAAKKVKADAVYVGYAMAEPEVDLIEAVRDADIATVGALPEIAALFTDRPTFAHMAEDASVRVVPAEEPIERARIVAALIAADQHGNVTALCDVDRSLGRALYIEECPSPQLSLSGEGEAIRGALFEAARRFVLQAKCTGLVLVEFLMDRDSCFWLDDVRLGLPRHHAAMEMVTGLDLVHLQLQIAAGEKLDESLELLQSNGHAMSAAIRIVGDDKGFEQPMIPPASPGRLRIERSVVPEGVIYPEDAPMAAKATAYAPLRHRALLTLDRMLAETTLGPSETNLKQLRQILNHDSFRAGQYDSEFAHRYL